MNNLNSQYPAFQGNYPQMSQLYYNYPSGMFPTLQDPQAQTNPSASKSKIKDEELNKIVQAIENLRNPEKR